MSYNLNSIQSLLTLRIKKHIFQEYFKKFFTFLQSPNNELISCIAFHNYFSLCSFITNKIYNLFRRLKESPVKTIDINICLEGFELLYLSDLNIRAKVSFKLLDFDNDGYINIEDAKLLFSHFHILNFKSK